jgi:predicted ArsR family transcriptional regulator
MNEQETAVHRALADGRRAHIVDELGSEPEGLDAQELSRRVGLHANTVRWHLGILSDAGVIESQAVPRATPGRPRIVYTLRARQAKGSDDYRLLATMLSGAVAGLADGEARAEEAGRSWGRYLVPRPLPGMRVSDDEATREVVQLLDQQGFAPEPAGPDIRMRRCPFHELAELHPEIVCSVHRGLISGALDELGTKLEVEALDIFVEPDLCVARLRRSGAS